MSNAEHFNIGRKAKSIDKSRLFDGYSQVIIDVTDDVSYSAGDTTGRTMTLICPWGTQQMANDILAQLRGYQYQPYESTGAKLDPAAELGDTVTINGLYGGVFTKSLNFGHNMLADISAPHDEEINHEYPYVSPTQRTIKRNAKQLRAELRVQADEIAAEVEARISDVESINSTLSIHADEIGAKVNSSQSGSFGWTLNPTSWTLISNGSTVLNATSSGIEIKGKITATSGKIGGFDIQSSYLSYNNQTWGGTNSTGIYVGQSGIQLGRNFKVDNAGNLTAASGTFLGTVRANMIDTGGDAGYITGSQIGAGTISGGSGGNIGYGTLGGFNMSGYINSGIAAAYEAQDVLANGVYCNYLRTRSLEVWEYGGFRMMGTRVGWRTINGQLVLAAV